MLASSDALIYVVAGLLEFPTKGECVGAFPYPPSVSVVEKLERHLSAANNLMHWHTIGSDQPGSVRGALIDGAVGYRELFLDVIGGKGEIVPRVRCRLLRRE